MTVIAFLNLQVGFLIYSPFLSPIQDPRGWNEEAKSPRAMGATTNPKDLGCGFPFENSTSVPPLPSVCVWVGGALEGSSKNYGVMVEEVTSCTNLVPFNGILWSSHPEG